MTTLGYQVDAKHVRIRIPRRVLPKFVKSLPKGISATVYPVIKEKGKLSDENIRNVTLAATRRNPDPIFRKDINDINNFLSRLNNIDPRIKLLSDKITRKDQPNLQEKPMIKLETNLDSPTLQKDKEMEPFLKKALQQKDIQKTKVTESYLRDMELRYKQMKKKFIETEFNRAELEEDKKKDPETGETVYILRHGEI